MEISLNELLQAVGASNNTETPFRVGDCYLIRTVTHYALGRVSEAGANFLVLKESSWIPDTGRFSDAVSMGELSEVEPITGNHIVAVGSIVDAVEWIHKLPTEQK